MRGNIASGLQNACLVLLEGKKKSDASQTVTVKLICSVYGTFTKLLLTHIYSNTKMRLYLKGYLHVEVLIKHTLRWY